MAEQSVVPIEQILPLRLPIVSLTGRPIFPGIFTPIMAGNPADVKAVEESAAADGFIGFALAARNDADTPVINDLYQVGTVAKIVKKINLPDGGDVYSFSNGGRWDGDGGGIHIGWADTRATFNMTGGGVVAGINGGLSIDSKDANKGLIYGNTPNEPVP
jgi:hypothetical protein